MRVYRFAAIAAGALLLAGCSGGDEPTATGPTQAAPTIDATETAAPDSTAQAAGDMDCTSITGTEAAQFVIWTQLFAQVRSVDGLQTMATLQYTPEQMSAILDKLDGLKGVEGPVYGKPDDALVVMRTANDTYATIISKGDAATDADFAPITALEPDTASWIKAQAAISTALGAACPDLDLS